VPIGSAVPQDEGFGDSLLWWHISAIRGASMPELRTRFAVARRAFELKPPMTETYSYG
jgi:hypothetical protein